MVNGKKLYHFTAEHLWERIQVQGLTLGMIAIPFGRSAATLFGSRSNPIIWLTDNPDHSAQKWDTQATIPYSRTAIRIEILIPDAKLHNLERWSSWAGKLSAEYAPGIIELNQTPGIREHAWLYFGKIPPTWFTDVTETQRAAAGDTEQEEILW